MLDTYVHLVCSHNESRDALCGKYKCNGMESMCCDSSARGCPCTRVLCISSTDCRAERRPRSVLLTSQAAAERRFICFAVAVTACHVGVVVFVYSVCPRSTFIAFTASRLA